MARSKKIDTHTWVHEGNERTVAIRMRYHNHPTKSTEFFAVEHDGTDDETTVAEGHSDVNDLIQAVEETFEEQYETEWDLYAWVGAYFNRGGRYNKTYTGLRVEWAIVAIGRTADGRDVWSTSVDLDGIERRDGEPNRWGGEWSLRRRSTIREGEPTEPAMRSGRSGEAKQAEVSLVEATPETINALLRVDHAMREVAAELRDRFAPDRVEETLAAVAGGSNVLPDPGSEGSRGRDPRGSRPDREGKR